MARLSLFLRALAQKQQNDLFSMETQIRGKNFFAPLETLPTTGKNFQRRTKLRLCEDNPHPKFQLLICLFGFKNIF
jgi:hypothetical protein